MILHSVKLSRIFIKQKEIEERIRQLRIERRRNLKRGANDPITSPDDIDQRSKALRSKALSISKGTNINLNCS